MIDKFLLDMFMKRFHQCLWAEVELFKHCP